MPTYLCHGFRWQRRSIRVYTVVQDLDDVSPEWLIKPTSSRCLLQSFYNLFEFLPYCNPPPQGYESGSWDSEESEEDNEEGSDEELKEGIAMVNGQEKNERSQWPERLESLGVIRASREKEKGKRETVEGKGEDASSTITTIHVGNESSSRTASRSPSLKLPLQGSRTSTKTRQTATSAAATPITTTPTAPTSRSTSTLGVSSSSRQKSKKTNRSRSSSHSPNRKKDELSAQRWSAVKVLEEYDPNNLDEVSRPYAYVADHVIRVDGAVDIMAEVKRYEERMQQKHRQTTEEETTPRASKAEKGWYERTGGRGSPVKNRLNRDSAGSGGTAGTTGRDEEYHDALEHLTEETAKQEKEQTWIEQLRDELQRGEEIKWYVVVNGDEERNYSNGFDDEDEEDETEDDYEEELSSESNYNYGTSYETEDHLTASDSLAAHPPTEGGSRSPYLSQHSAGSRSRTSSRGGRSKSKSRSQSRSHSRTRDRHRNHSRQRHGKKIRRPKPTKEQRQHHAQYTLQQELFERNDLRASASSATASGTSTPIPTQTPTPILTPTPTTTITTTAVSSTTRGIMGSTTATGRPRTTMRNTKAIIKEGAARRVMSEGGVHRQSSRGIPVVPRSPEIPIIMVTPTRMTFPGSPTGASGAGTADAGSGAGAGAAARDGADKARTGTADGRPVVSEKQHQQQPQQEQRQQQHQPQYEPRQQEQHPQQPLPHHQQQPQREPQQQQQQQYQPQQQRDYPQPTPSRPTTVNGAGSSMGIITTAPAAAVSSFSLDTTPSNTVVPGPSSHPSSSNPNHGSKNPGESKSHHHPPLSFSFGGNFGNFGGNREHGRDGGHNSGTSSKRSSLTSLRTPSSWSCLSLSLGHGHKDKDGHHSAGSGEDNSELIQPPRPSPSPPIALHPNDSYEPVSTLPPRPAPPPPASAVPRPGQPLTPPPPIGTGYESNHNRVPTAPSSPVAIKISATPGAAETMMVPDAEAAAAPPVVGQYSSKTMPTRKGNHGRYGSRSRSSGSLRRLFQRTSGKEGWI